MSTRANPDGNGWTGQKVYRVIEATSATVLISAMVIVLTLQVFFRYVVKAPLYWSEELARFLLIWAVFAGATFAFRHRTHMAIDVVKYVFPDKAVWLVDIAGKVVMTAFFVLLLLVSWQFVLRFVDIRSAAMEIPLAVVYIILPVTTLANILVVWLDKVEG